MPSAILKGRLINNTGPTTKRIESLGSTLRPRNAHWNTSDFEALYFSQVSEVRLLVSSAQFSQELYAGILEIRFIDLPGRLGAVERQQVMASKKVSDI